MTVYHHLNQLFVNIQVSGLDQFREDSGVQMQLFTGLDVTCAHYLYTADSADSTGHISYWIVVFYIQGTPSEEIPKLVPDHILLQACEQVTPDQLTSFVIGCLRLSEAVLSEIKQSEDGQFNHTLFECFIRWRNKLECAGVNAEQKLQEILSSIQETPQSAQPSRVLDMQETAPESGTYWWNTRHADRFTRHPVQQLSIKC